MGILKEMVKWDPTAEELHHVVVYDSEPVIEHAKRLYRAAEDGNGGYNADRSWKRAAIIPPEVYYKWLTEEGIDALNQDHWPAVAAKLDSPEWSYLRTAPGRIGRRPHRIHPVTHNAARERRVIHLGGFLQPGDD